MNKLFTVLLIAATTAFISFTGCKKKCDLGENVTSGDIKADVSVYAESGYLTTGWSSDDYHINGTHTYASQFKVSTDGGITKTAVNYNEYSILCYPMTVNCFAQFDRSVLIDDEGGVVKYTIRVKDCGKCEEQRYVENYIAIRAIPDSYTILYDVDITTQE